LNNIIELNRQDFINYLKEKSNYPITLQVNTKYLHDWLEAREVLRGTLVFIQKSKKIQFGLHNNIIISSYDDMIEMSNLISMDHILKFFISFGPYSWRLFEVNRIIINQEEIKFN